MHRARLLWTRLETLHAVTYFAPESHAAAADAGLRGFWMGYFGFRAAPLGPVGPPVVEAIFANFAPAMVRRSLPDAWSYATPDALIELRAKAAAAALRRLVPDIDRVATDCIDPLRAVVEAAGPLGRPLFAANAALTPPDDPVAGLWQLTTTVREHRGDGHVATLSVEGLDGPSAHQLHAAEHATPHELLQPNRGWDDDAWTAAATRLETHGLVDAGSLTDAGRTLRDRIEHRTDELAWAPIERALDADAFTALVDALSPAAETVTESGTIPFPNPMGLPRPSAADHVDP